MRQNYVNPIRSWAAIFVILCFVVALSAQAPAITGDDPTVEQDYLVAKLDERQRVIAELRTTADQLRQSGQALEAVRTLNRVGRFQIRNYVADEAVQTFRQALKLLEQQPDIRTRIDSLNGLAASYDSLTNCGLAEPPANTAITLSTQANYVAGKAQALLTLSHCQNHRDHSLAMKSAQESLELSRSTNRKRGIADAHVAIAEYEMGESDLLESEKNLKTALGLYRELNSTEQQATVLIHLGFVEYRYGAWQNALGFYTQAQSLIDDKTDSYRMAQITGGLGEAFLESGLHEVALAKFSEGLSYFRSSKSARGVTAMVWSIGRAQYMLGDYREALESLQKARTDAVKSRDRTLTAFCDDFLGRTYYALNDYGAALRHFKAALDGYEKAGNTMERSRTLALMGQVYQAQGDLGKAWNNYETAIKMFRALADHVNESATLYAMGSLKLRQNDLNAAEDYLQQSIDVTENIRRVSTSNDLALAFAATVHDRYETYIECLMRKHRANPAQRFDIRALETSELARGHSLAELLRATQTNLVPGLDPQLAEQEKYLRQTLRFKENYKINLLARKYAPQELAELEAEIARLETEYKQVTEVISARYPSYAQLNQPKGWDLRKIQEEVVTDDQTLLLEYSLGSEKSYVWTVTRNEIRSYELPPQARINEAAQNVYRLLTATDTARRVDELNQATRELGQLILSPVAGQLNKARLIVVPDGALNYIPFQILPAATGGNEPLVAATEVINAPSATILGQLRQETARRQAPTEVLAAFGDPIFAANYPQRKDAGSGEYIASTHSVENERWPPALRDIEPAGDSYDPLSIGPLFYSKLELANLRAVAGPQSLIATGFDASRENLASANLGNYAILHFATHGILDPKRPEYSGLFLSMVNRNGKAQNGFVALQDIYSLHAPVDLVVLSACRTGLGKDVRGEGLVGLTRGFMYAGASSVIASLWKVDDEATAELMKRFYANMLQGGMTPAAALRAAQNSIRQEPQWRSPYFWAAFTLQGEYRQVIKRTPAQPLPLGVRIVIGLSLLLLFAVGARWFRRSGPVNVRAGFATPL